MAKEMGAYQDGTSLQCRTVELLSVLAHADPPDLESVLARVSDASYLEDATHST
jgi:hypothetical protein